MSEALAGGEMEGSDQNEHPPQEMMEGDEVNMEFEYELCEQLLADPVDGKDSTDNSVSQSLVEEAVPARATIIDLSHKQGPQVRREFL